ncbi:hypothetical protein CJ030_MR2G012419 [Morella rubra]|uniref:Uncharacterized protein n=1 Tax=Morella rubra TaxID=262757 RepID=A0A6A1WDP8_9ROSI|nr:hypothetical protein CJ030_MR2G012419 [Morella rubra]
MFQLSMMRGLPAKLMAAVVVVSLLVGDIQTTSASLPYGGRKSTLWLADTGDVPMKMEPRKEDSTGGLNIGSKQIVSLRGFRGRVPLSPPPSPLKNRQSSMDMPAHPAPLAVFLAPPPQVA